MYRMKRDMSGNTLAELVGLSRHAIMDYENGVTAPSLEDVKAIAAVLDIEADKLYDEYYRFLDYPYAERVKEIRTEHNLLQRELGEMLGVGRRTVERWENSKTVVTRERWEQLKLLGLL
jgi:transcriptional regulator with XRE-family HTH domain